MTRKISGKSGRNRNKNSETKDEEDDFSSEHLGKGSGCDVRPFY